MDRGARPKSQAPKDRDPADDAEARRWAREARDALEAGELSDDTERLRKRLAAEKAKKPASS